MPQLDSYHQGTVALNANATLVTGSGTAWTDAGAIVQQVHMGDWFVIGTFASLILEVISPTQLRLASVYPGPSVSGAGYDIIRYTQLATPALVAFMQRERARGGPTSPLVRLDVDTGNVRLSLRDGGDGKGGIYVGATATADADQIRALAFDAVGNAQLASTGGLLLPAGTTAQRLAAEGQMRRNSQTKRVEVYLDGAWHALAYADGDTIKSDVDAPASVAAPYVAARQADRGSAELHAGEGTRPGSLELSTPDGVRRLLLGRANGELQRLLLQAENGWALDVGGGFNFLQRPTLAGVPLIGAADLGFVTPEMFNSAAGTGGNDRTALQAALSTGRNVYCDPSKQYTFDGPLYVDGTVDQDLVGGVLRPIGNFNAIVARGAKGFSLDVSMRCVGMSGGYAVEFRENCERCQNKRLLILDSPYNLVYVEQSNWIGFDFIYGINLRGPRGVRWYGDAGKRSDILVLNGGAIAGLSGNTSLVALDWDGNCNSLFANNLHCVSVLNSLLVRNSGGGPIPQIGRLTAFGSDFTYGNGINITAGDDIDFLMPYINGAGFNQSAGSYHGMLVDGPGDLGTIRVFGGKSIGNRGHGYACNPAGSLFVFGSRAYGNAESNGFQLHGSSLLL